MDDLQGLFTAPLDHHHTEGAEQENFCVVVYSVGVSCCMQFVWGIATHIYTPYDVKDLECLPIQI